VVEWEVERSLGKPKMDAEGGGQDRKQRRKKKRETKERTEGEKNTLETGQRKQDGPPLKPTGRHR